jgi:hypothetical protein
MVKLKVMETWRRMSQAVSEVGDEGGSGRVPERELGELGLGKSEEAGIRVPVPLSSLHMVIIRVGERCWRGKVGNGELLESRHDKT